MRALAIEALKFWGVTGCEPELLKYRENAVFRVIAPDGRPAALRIHRHGYHSDAELRSELAGCRHYEQTVLTFLASCQREITPCLLLRSSTRCQNLDK